ncbi:hypothetical protein [Roseibacillus ishigakijimensis]|uniref:Uncharacterized protein n=1 Tax=Roseibacillus ishigakijimensis TaxID=454146 RepID=A0A934VLA1_9BACT|nr:hypothetical protein [Roseibacillus ishigakijimensis]MBK1832670.1 hypothetical protein [Roseibacillus ishigakijimensis]
MADYIPQSDPEFQAWQKTLLAAFTADPASYGLTAEQLATLSDLQAPWEEAYTAWGPAQDAARAATTVKYEKRENYEKQIRTLSQLI